MTVATAAAKGDGVSARIALEEARELRPEAPEIADAERRVALLPMAVPVAAPAGYFRSRTFNAFAILSVGVALVTALDFVRSRESAPPATTVAPALTPALTLRTVDAARAGVPDLTPPAPAVANPEIETVPIADEPDSLGAIGTRGAPPAPVSPEPAPAPPLPRERVVPPPIVVPAVTLADAVVDRQPAPEIPDDFVAPQPRREAIVASPVLSRASRVPPLVPPPAVPAGPAAGPEAAAASAASAPVLRDESLVSSVLDRYARAYVALDASAARDVWPSVDERALARAFAGLESQHVSFDDCNIDVRGEIANASCRGLASYVGKVGNRQPRTEPRQWTFELRRDGGAWRIESAETRLTQ